MRRKDRERDRSFAWEVLKKAPYATLSLTDSQGRPYAVPVNQAVARSTTWSISTAPEPEKSGSF